MSGYSAPYGMVSIAVARGAETMTEFTDVAPETVGLADELIQARLTGAVHVPLSAFNPDAIPSDSGKKVVFVCAIGQRSAQAGSYMVSQGLLTEAYNLAGGLQAWAAAGRPFDSGPTRG